MAEEQQIIVAGFLHDFLENIQAISLELGRHDVEMLAEPMQRMVAQMADFLTIHFAGHKRVVITGQQQCPFADRLFHQYRAAVRRAQQHGTGRVDMAHRAGQFAAAEGLRE